MSVHVRWYDPHRSILCLTFINTWSWNDYYEAIDTAFTLADTVDTSFALLFDLRETAFLPADLMSQLKRIINLRHPRETARVVVSNLLFWRSLYTVCTQLYPSAAVDSYFVATMAEARAVIATHGHRQAG